MNQKAKIQELQIALRLILDCVDYTNNACNITEMVGAVLPKIIIEKAHKALNYGTRKVN